MAANDCSTCKGTGTVRELQRLRPGKLVEPPLVKCPNCDGTGKNHKR